jgi:hypothetical protein
VELNPSVLVEIPFFPWFEMKCQKNVSEFSQHGGKAEWNHFDPSRQLKNTFRQSQYRVERARRVREGSGVGARLLRIRTQRERQAGNKPSRQTSLVCPGTLALLTIKSLAAFGRHRIENSNNRRHNIHSWFPCYANPLRRLRAALSAIHILFATLSHSKRWCASWCN